MPVIVDVEPGDVMAEGFVVGKVNVLVCELNSQTTVAVLARPEFTPTMLMVSARTVELTPGRMRTAASARIYLLNRDMENPPPCSFLWTNHIARRVFLRPYKCREKLAGNTNHTVACVRVILEA